MVTSPFFHHKIRRIIHVQSIKSKVENQREMGGTGEVSIVDISTKRVQKGWSDINGRCSRLSCCLCVKNR